MGVAFGAFLIMLGIALLTVILACVPVPNRRVRMGYLVTYLGAVVGFVAWASATQGMPVAMGVVFLGPGAAITLIRLYFAVTAAFRKA